jgi:hypothetical protein
MDYKEKVEHGRLSTASTKTERHIVSTQPLKLEVASTKQHTVASKGERELDIGARKTASSSVTTATLSPSSRRGHVSINNFIEFTFPERTKPSSSSVLFRRRYPTAPYLKERFVHANFRFLIRSDRDYAVALSDPDMVIDWDDVEQVLVTIFHEITCPICLIHPPVVAKTTKCGHIFCWTCILHYCRSGNGVDVLFAMKLFMIKTCEVFG